jgi:hypothetical protein
MNPGIIMTNKLIPNELEGFNYGMNDVDNIKKLPPQILNYLHNAYPDKSLTPMNGITDIDSTSTAANSVEALYTPTSLHIYMDGVDYLFVITEKYYSTRTGRDEWGLEIWDITNATRHQWFEWEYNGPYTAGAWDGSKFQDTQNYHVEFSLTKQYNSVYLTMTHRTTCDFQYDGGNGIDRYITRNKIFEWDSASSLWVQREMGIDVTPSVNLFDLISNYAGTSNYLFCTFFDTEVHESKLYKTGGYYGYFDLTDDKVYSSYDGVNFQVDSVLPNNNTLGCQIVSFNGVLYYFSARTGGTSYVDDIFKQDENGDWQSHLSNPPWGNLEGFSCLVFKNKVWVIGGMEYDGNHSNDVYYNTVYSSSDLETWTTVTSSAIAGYDGFAYHGACVYDDKMWIFGGVYDNGAGTVEPKTFVYNSSDGSTWTLIGAIPADSDGRHNVGVSVFNGKIYFAGGLGNWSGLWIPAHQFEDSFHSTDGVTWTSASTAVYDEPDHDQTPRLETFQNQLVCVCNERAYASTDGSTYNINTGGLEYGKYYSYAFTFVRRTDVDSKLADDSGFGSVPDRYQYTPWETVKGATVVPPDEILLTGTITVAGTAVTGVSTLFSSELSVGDYIRIGGVYNAHKVTAITNNTSMTIQNSNSFTYSAVEFSLLPAVGDNITTNVYHTGDLEGVEDINNRLVIKSESIDSDSTAFFNVVTFAKRLYNDSWGYWYNPGGIQGATHIRVYRTIGHATESTAKGLPHRFLVDINITGDNQEYDPQYYIDRTTDDYLTGVTHYLEMTPYSIPPLGRYSLWANNILWISGVTEYEVLDNDSVSPGGDDSFNYINGRVYHSVNPKSGDVSYDALNPQKFGSMFDLQKDYKECNANDGQNDTGLIELSGDLFVFKENSIFIIRNSNPVNNPEEVSKNIGCVCPHTITKADVPIFGGSVVFFYSGQGWAYLLPGGEVKLFIDFKVSDVQQYAGILKRNATGQTDQPTDWHSRTKVSSTFWDNTLWMFYGDNADDQCQINEAAAANGTLKIAGFHFAPDQESNGAFVRDFTSISSKYEPQVLIPVDNNRAYTFSHIDEYKLTRWNDPTKYIDTLIESDTPTTYSNNVKIITRAYPTDPTQMFEWLCEFVNIYIDFNDTETFTIKIYSDVNKQVATCSFSQNRNSGMMSYSDFQYRDFITIKTQQDLRHSFYYHIEITKQTPSDGDIELHGVKFALQDKLERVDPEHVDTFGSASNVNFVVEADTDPEVNAHA